MNDDIDVRVARLVRPEVQALKSYAVPDAGGLVKLDAMENPYPWPPELRQAWLESLRAVALNRYPDAGARRLKARLRAHQGVPPGMELLLGNGSDEIIQMILIALGRPGAAVLAPVPTFVMYHQIASALGLAFVGVPLAEGFALDLPAMLAAVRRHRPAAVFLAYPNNPTGNLFRPEAITAILGETPGVVVVDEAYSAFTDASFMERLSQFGNLLVMRTLSKIGLAGLRLGLLAGERRWIEQLDKVRLPYNIGSLNQASAEFALAHEEYLAAQTARIRAERERLYAALAAMPGFTVWPSQANFVLFRVADARRVHQALLHAGILIKNLDPAGGPLAGCLRVTVGTPEENDAFLAALRRSV